jgi:signal recognition particle subunit SRP54
MALLEADVNFKVVKAFIDRVRDRAVGEDVLKSLTPAQQVVAHRARRDAGAVRRRQGGLPRPRRRPRIILLLGLQGSGKTDDQRQARPPADARGRHPIMVSTDVPPAGPPSSSSASSASS